MIVTMIGSARFEPWFRIWNEALTRAGHNVFGPCAKPCAAAKMIGATVSTLQIAASDAVLVLNVFAYVGESTLREIAEAHRLGKRVFTLESWGVGNGIGRNHYQRVQDAAKKYGVPAGFGSPFDARQGPNGFAYSLLGEGGPERSALVDFIHEREAELVGRE